MDESPSVTRFRAYLRCDTSHPDPDFTDTVALLRTWAEELGLRFTVHAETDAMPVVVMTWAGEVPEALVLNSHMDVVPATRSSGWTVDPFGAERRDGRIYARGAQDMKCVAVQYIEAVRRLREAAFRPHHTLHLTFMPDEEIGGHCGMARLVNSSLWHSLLPALVLDEGLPHMGPEGYHLFHAERAPWWINVKIHGTTGHASQFLKNTAGPKLTRILSRFDAFRSEQNRLVKEEKKEDGTPYTLGDVTTINLTMLQGGVEHNVLPDPLLVGFDLRIPPTVSLDEFKSQMEGWCLCEEGVTVEYLQYTSTHSSTPLDTKWFHALVETAQSMNLTLFPSTMPASTDARFVRPHVPAYGISPLRNTLQLLHAVDEYLDETVFLEGIDFYERAIRALDKVR